MKKTERRHNRRDRRASSLFRVLKWGAALGIVAVVAYGISQSSGVPFDENDIKVINFSGLAPDARRTALREANRARCTCGCGMTLAQCVATDSTCPIRQPNIERIRAMVRDAGSS